MLVWLVWCSSGLSSLGVLSFGEGPTEDIRSCRHNPCISMYYVYTSTIDVVPVFYNEFFSSTFFSSPFSPYGMLDYRIVCEMFII